MSTHRNPFKLMETWFGYVQGNVPIAAIPSQIVSTPSLNLGTSSLGSPGTEQTFTVEGTNLLTDIVVTGTTNVEVSLTSGAGFTSSVAVSPSGGTVAATTIYARTKSTAPVGAVAETLGVASGGAPGYGVACSGTVSSAPAFPSTGLVAYWGFDDSLTDSVGSKVLTASGGNSYVAGKLGAKALQLTAGNGASVASNDFNFITNPCTVAFWAKKAAGGIVTVHYYLGDDAISIQSDNGGTQVQFSGDVGGSAPAATDSYAVPDDTWTFYCFRFDGANIYGNVNARTEVSIACTTLGDATGGSLEIVSFFATCVFDGLAVWNVCLTDQQVANVYNGGDGNSP